MSRKNQGTSAGGSAGRRSHGAHPLTYDEDDVLTVSPGVSYRRAVVSSNVSQGVRASRDLERNMPKDNPLCSGDSSGEYFSDWPVARSPVHKRAQPLECEYGSAGGFREHVELAERRKNNQDSRWLHVGPTPGRIGRPSPMLDQPSDDDDDEMLFWSPFGATSQINSTDMVEGDIRLGRFPRTFRLERTNFTLKWRQKSRPSVNRVIEVLHNKLEAVELDIVNFRKGDCVHECTFHRANLFLGVWIRMFLPPDPASGQLYSTEKSSKNDEDNAFLIELQLREGERLYFSAICRELQQLFMGESDDVLYIGGTYKYQNRSPPASGEGLCLEEVKPSTRQNPHILSRGVSLLAPSSVKPLHEEAGVDEQSGEGGISDEDFEDAAADIVTLTEMLGGKLIDVQVDAATALAGITADGSTLRWLSRDTTAEVMNMMYSAIVPLMMNGCSRGVLRQISVVAGNLSCSKKICERVFKDTGEFSRSREFVETLACISLGYSSRDHQASGKVSDYEIGTRRECMRTLVNIARHVTSLKNFIKYLLGRDASDRGATDRVLQARLQECRGLVSEV